LRELKNSYSFIDPTTYSSEISREVLYNDLDFLKYSFIKDFIKIINERLYSIPINFNILNNYYLYFLGSKTNYKSLEGNQQLYKSQYRPMRKSITNMIRLQDTNAIAMPTEIRLHLLASSKDVIHS
jgi:hypothetical protein